MEPDDSDVICSSEDNCYSPGDYAILFDYHNHPIIFTLNTLWIAFVIVMLIGHTFDKKYKEFPHDDWIS